MVPNVNIYYHIIFSLAQKLWVPLMNFDQLVPIRILILRSGSSVYYHWVYVLYLKISCFNEINSEIIVQQKLLLVEKIGRCWFVKLNLDLVNVPKVFQPTN